jgi:uncharacterized protein (TIGR02996 family)
VITGAGGRIKAGRDCPRSFRADQVSFRTGKGTTAMTDRLILEREQLLLDVLARTDSDDVRLIFADWQDEHGQGNHAELIRTQVEIERLKRRRVARGDPRRKALRRRELELLALPEFGEVALEQRNRGLRYERGFVAQQRIGLFATEVEMLARTPGIDRVVGFCLWAFAFRPEDERLRLLSGAWWGPRIESLYFVNPMGENDGLEDHHLEVLASISALQHVRDYLFHEVYVPILALPSLLRRGKVPLRSLVLENVWTWADGPVEAGRAHPAVDGFFESLAALPRAAGLRELTSDLEGLGERGLAALLGSPVLASLSKASLHVHGAVDGGLLRQAEERSWHVVVR